MSRARSAPKKEILTNPEMSVTKRPYISANDNKMKLMSSLIWSKILGDKNTSFKYCGQCHIIAETRSGSDLHKTCQNVLTAKQIKGKFLI